MYLEKITNGLIGYVVLLLIEREMGLLKIYL